MNNQFSDNNTAVIFRDTIIDVVEDVYMNVVRLLSLINTAQKLTMFGICCMCTVRDDWSQDMVDLLNDVRDDHINDVDIKLCVDVMYETNNGVMNAFISATNDNDKRIIFSCILATSVVTYHHKLTAILEEYAIANISHMNPIPIFTLDALRKSKSHYTKDIFVRDCEQGGSTRVFHDHALPVFLLDLFSNKSEYISRVVLKLMDQPVRCLLGRYCRYSHDNTKHLPIREALRDLNYITRSDTASIPVIKQHSQTDPLMYMLVTMYTIDFIRRYTNTTMAEVNVANLHIKFATTPTDDNVVITINNFMSTVWHNILSPPLLCQLLHQITFIKNTDEMRLLMIGMLVTLDSYIKDLSKHYQSELNFHAKLFNLVEYGLNNFESVDGSRLENTLSRFVNGASIINTFRVDEDTGIYMTTRTTIIKMAMIIAESVKPSIMTPQFVLALSMFNLSLKARNDTLPSVPTRVRIHRMSEVNLKE